MKYFRIMVAVMLLTACGNFLNDSNVFQSGKLKGKYKVDLTPFVAEAVKTEQGDDKWSKMSKGLSGLALSSVDIELSFYDNNKGIMHMDGGLIDFANAFSDKPVEKLHEFTYKVEQDSILYMKGNNEKEYKKWAIVRKFSENYDYLQFLIVEEGKDKVFFNLKKLGE